MNGFAKKKKHTYTYIYINTKKRKKVACTFFRVTQFVFPRQSTTGSGCEKNLVQKKKKIHETRCSSGLDVLFVFTFFFFHLSERKQCSLPFYFILTHTTHSPLANSNHIFRLNRVSNSHRRGDKAGGQLALYSPQPTQGR